ncbi:TetR/AcrR family transcriptional regulator [Planctomonas sp. JC2975]|uniref:TetR/AcrR family transcriptional regulator n=1 Tax=Planctomonas sp. JC2975 TaxID=2729626 RepID=UPI001476710B|nr:TetR/AcrR family transcriptional regulator [Planctomonas sp. JC2975]NNC10916.1 TetR/AcrR family transcriptional regulator [Planctomonas sp. JC2975]
MTRQRATRSDSTRNRERILDAAMQCFLADPSATMSAIAEAAGVGRVTLYAHFESRTALVAALFRRTVDESDASLESVNLDGDPAAALDALTRSSWRIVARFHAVLGTARDELGEDAVRGQMEHALGRVRGVIERGRASGAFRSDQSADWLTFCYLAIVHGAADEIRNGRLTDSDATEWVPATVASIVTAP